MKFASSLFVVLILCVTAHGKLRRAATPAKESRRPGEFRLPPDLRPKDIPKLRIPNSELCAQLELDPAQHYIVLPWWYQHCQGHKEKKIKKSNSKLRNLDFYVETLRRVNAAKKLAKKRQDYQKMYE